MKLRKLILLLIISFCLIPVISRIPYVFAQTSPGQDVSVSVEPHPSEFSVSIGSSTDETVNQNTEIEYTITYGSNLSYTTPLTIQADWSLGTIEGSTSPDVEVADYLLGSATPAYGDTPATIDLVNRRITWDIPSFPANTTDRTVTFRLKTNDNYQGANAVDFTVYGRAINGSVIVSDQTSNTYQFSEEIVTPTPTLAPSPTPTSILTPTTTPEEPQPTSSVTSAPTPSPTLTSSPTPNIVNLAFSNVSVQTLSSAKATLLVELNQAAKITAYYGIKTNALTKILKQNLLASSQIIDLNDLTPETTYYVQLLATSEDGKTLKSDIFSFKTPGVGPIPQPELISLVIISQNTILTSPSIKEESAIEENKKTPPPAVVIPKESLYRFRFEIKNYESVRKIEASLRAKNVLGAILGQEIEAPTEIANMVMVAPGVFEGTLRAPAEPGDYIIVTRVFDNNGNIAESKIADVKVVNKLTVLKQGDPSTVIESARVLLYVYDLKTNDFELVSPAAYAIENPSYTDNKGEDNIVLPAGKYKVSISAIGYETKDVVFIIDAKHGGNYPTVYLKSQPFNLLTFTNYYFSAASDFIILTAQYLQVVAMSNRFLEINAATIILITLILTILTLSFHSKVPLRKMHWYIFSFWRQIFHKAYLNRYIKGQIIDDQSKIPVKDATVYLINPSTNAILQQTKTNKLGDFYFNKLDLDKYKFLVLKKDYQEHPLFEFSTDSIGEKLTLGVKKSENINIFRQNLVKMLDAYIMFFVPLFLIVSILMEIIFGFSFGFLKALPFVIISVINILFWTRFFQPSFQK